MSRWGTGSTVVKLPCHGGSDRVVNLQMQLEAMAQPGDPNIGNSIFTRVLKTERLLVVIMMGTTGRPIRSIAKHEHD